MSRSIKCLSSYAKWGTLRLFVKREFDVKNPFPRTEGSTFSNDSQTKDVLRHSQSMRCVTHKACVATLTKHVLRHT